MRFKRYMIGLAIAAGLAVPATASAAPSVKVVANSDTVDIYAPKGQCITVSIRRLHHRAWESLDADSSDNCATSFTFSPDTPDRTGVSYFKYRIKRVVITGGKATVATPPLSDYGYPDVYTCFDEVDNDGDGLVDDADDDFPEAEDVAGDPDSFNTCDRGVQPIHIVPTATLRTGWIRVKTDYYPAEPVYQYINGHYNDRFFNYCIQEGKRLRSASHGRFYCIDPSSTYRYNTLRAP